jgi:hypothetical protein
MNLTLGANSYSTNSRLSTFDQLHVARKLGPALPLVDGLVRLDNAAKNKQLLVVLMFSRISDEDTDDVIKKCLRVVLRKQGPDYVKVQGQGDVLMFDDITMADLLELTMAVIEENLGDFFRTSLAVLETKAPPA